METTFDYHAAPKDDELAEVFGEAVLHTTDITKAHLVRAHHLWKKTVTLSVEGTWAHRSPLGIAGNGRAK